VHAGGDYVEFLGGGLCGSVFGSEMCGYSGPVEGLVFVDRLKM